MVVMFVRVRLPLPDATQQRTMLVAAFLIAALAGASRAAPATNGDGVGRAAAMELVPATAGVGKRGRKVGLQLSPGLVDFLARPHAVTHNVTGAYDFCPSPGTVPFCKCDNLEFGFKLDCNIEVPGERLSSFPFLFSSALYLRMKVWR